MYSYRWYFNLYCVIKLTGGAGAISECKNNNNVNMIPLIASKLTKGLCVRIRSDHQYLL